MKSQHPVNISGITDPFGSRDLIYFNSQDNNNIPSGGAGGSSGISSSSSSNGLHPQQAIELLRLEEAAAAAGGTRSIMCSSGEQQPIGLIIQENKDPDDRIHHGVMVNANDTKSVAALSRVQATLGMAEGRRLGNQINRVVEYPWMKEKKNIRGGGPPHNMSGTGN